MFEKQLRKVREVHPLVHSITNPVTINDVANMIIACGASAIMAMDPQEVQEITAIADGRMTWFHGTRIDNPNTHGTGCTLSSAIASWLARGFDLKESITHAKKYLSGALSSMLDLGKGAPADPCKKTCIFMGL